MVQLTVVYSVLPLIWLVMLFFDHQYNRCICYILLYFVLPHPLKMDHYM